MDITSLVGIILGVGAIILGNIAEGSSFSSILQLTAGLIVFGGTFGAIFLGYPLRSVLMAISSLKTVFFDTGKDMNAVINQIVTLSYKARKEGIIALDLDAQKIPEPFLRRALTLAIDGTDSKVLRQTMEIEMDHIESEMEIPARVYDSAGGIAPTIGILGAVLGLIHVMQNLTDPSKLGGGIAVAFVATVYGVGSANLIFIPIGTKLKNRIKQDMVYYEAILEGILSIQNGDNPRLIEEKLKGFLTTKEKEDFISAHDRAKIGGRAKIA